MKYSRYIYIPFWLPFHVKFFDPRVPSIIYCNRINRLKRKQKVYDGDDDYNDAKDDDDDDFNYNAKNNYHANYNAKNNYRANYNYDNYNYEADNYDADYNNVDDNDTNDEWRRKKINHFDVCTMYKVKIKQSTIIHGTQVKPFMLTGKEKKMLFFKYHNPTKLLIMFN